MGACKTKIKKNSNNSDNRLSHRNLTIKTEFNATQETIKKRQGLLQIEGEKYLNSPSSGGYLLSNRQITRTQGKKGTALLVNTSRKGLDQIVNSNASKKYSQIQKRLTHDNIKILQNNKTGVIVEMLTLSKKDPYSTLYVEWLLNADIDHDNIIKLLEVYQDQNQYQVIYEHFDGKDLSEVIMESNKKMAKKQMAQIVEQMLKVMDYLHCLKQTHGHLSLHSFRVKQIENDIVVKLVDLQKVIIKDPEFEDIQWLKFTSPECSYNTENYSKSRDIYAIGLLGYTLRKSQLLIQFPTTSLTTFQQIQQIVRATDFSFENKKDLIYKDFLSTTLNKDPRKRKNCTELLSHPFIKQNSKSKKVPQTQLLQNILHAKSYCLIQELILGYFLQEFNWEEYILIQKLFYEGDTDMDGLLSKEEIINLFKIYCKDLQDIEQQINDLFQLFELNDKGGMNNSHFQALATNRQILLTKTNIEICFSIFSNNKAEITIRGLRRHLNYYGQDLTDEFAKITNSDNSLTYSQFEKLILLLL